MQPLSSVLSLGQLSLPGIVSRSIQGAYTQNPSAVFEESLSRAISDQDAILMKSLTESQFFQEMPIQKFFEVLYGCVSLENVNLVKCLIDTPRFRELPAFSADYLDIQQVIKFAISNFVEKSGFTNESGTWVVLIQLLSTDQGKEFLSHEVKLWTLLQHIATIDGLVGELNTCGLLKPSDLDAIGEYRMAMKAIRGVGMYIHSSVHFEQNLSLAVSNQDVDSMKSLTENSFFQEMPIQKFFEVLYGCVSLGNVNLVKCLIDTPRFRELPAFSDDCLDIGHVVEFAISNFVNQPEFTNESGTWLVLIQLLLTEQGKEFLSDEVKLWTLLDKIATIDELVEELNTCGLLKPSDLDAIGEYCVAMTQI